MDSRTGWEIALACFSVGVTIAVLVAEGGAYAAVAFILVTTLPATLLATYTAVRPWAHAGIAWSLAVGSATAFLVWIESAYALAIPLAGMLIGIPTSSSKWIRSASALLLGFSMVLAVAR